MNRRAYEVLLQFSQGMDQAIELRNTPRSWSWGSRGREQGLHQSEQTALLRRQPFCVQDRAKGAEEENDFYPVRRTREKAEDGPDEIYLERRLPPRAVIFPWSHADDAHILAMRKAASFWLSTQSGQPWIVNDSRQDSQEGGTPT